MDKIPCALLFLVEDDVLFLLSFLMPSVLRRSFVDRAYYDIQ
jgi:hypothetical protein